MYVYIYIYIYIHTHKRHNMPGALLPATRSPALLAHFESIGGLPGV